MAEALARRDSDLALVERAKDYIADSMAENTRRAYNSDFRQFSAWCAEAGLPALPASPGAVAAYLSALADAGRRVSTIERARAAIKVAHETAGAADPTAHKHVALTLRGIRRRLGAAPTKKAPILTNDIRAMVDALPDSLLGLRDRAILLLGFAGAFRRSELAYIHAEHIEYTAEGVRVYLPRSKTDQEGQGRYVGIKRGTDPRTCPVRALAAWCDAAGISSGPVFRMVDRHGNIRGPITPQTVALVVKRACRAAGLDPERYSGHSLRAGFVTQAALSGATESNIMRQTGHTSSATVKGYIRIANIFCDNASGLLGL